MSEIEFLEKLNRDLEQLRIDLDCAIECQNFTECIEIRAKIDYITELKGFI